VGIEKINSPISHFGSPDLTNEAPATSVDMVNHPPHYSGYAGFEVIDVVEQLDYLRGTAVKYIMRAGKKWNAVEDIDKAIWYLTRYRDKLKEALDKDKDIP